MAAEEEHKQGRSFICTLWLKLLCTQLADMCDKAARMSGFAERTQSVVGALQVEQLCGLARALLLQHDHLQPRNKQIGSCCAAP